jgi:hypothetical protein
MTIEEAKALPIGALLCDGRYYVVRRKFTTPFPLEENETPTGWQIELSMCPGIDMEFDHLWVDWSGMGHQDLEFWKRVRRIA